ncbi:MAG: hypothetical protein JWR51_2292 [Devosia sp.]|uniref:glycosyltransferase n=1 Tax=Devosia sp. TaxID=1871048 RepID=UPI002618DD43|nr:glycosyltransferase [Devosia sp.]MDB5529189.1 hypothetical protein [Devosia sp.]
MKQSIIFVMNRWDSSKGGIQTVNRELLLALAKTRPDLNCIAVVSFADKSEVEQAYNNNVTLLHGAESDKWESVMLSEDVRRIDPSSVLAVVGHSSFSGKQALLLRNTYFKQANTVQFIHMDPMRTEGMKEGKKDRYVSEREEKQRAELEAAKSADLVFCVGPRLTRVTKDTFKAHQLDHNKVHRIDCGLSPEQPVRNAAPEQPTVVCLGRTESVGVKGLDIFALMAGIIDKEWTTSAQTRSRILKPRFVVRGAESEPEKLQEALVRLAEKAGGNPEIVVRPYTTDKQNLNADLRGATAFLMPSREEGYGLVACEAMSFGAPIVVSRQSGIAELILETGAEAGQDFGSCVVDTSGDAHAAAQRFADATLPLLIDGSGDSYFYPRLRGHLESKCSWEAGANALIEVVETAYQNRAVVKSAPASPHQAAPNDDATLGSAQPVDTAPTIHDVLDAERDALMTKQGVIGVGIKQAIVVTVEKGAKPNLPHKIEGFEVVVREVEEIKLTSANYTSGHELLVNGERRATVGLFGADVTGQLFAVTVAHAFPTILQDSIEMVVDGRRIPLTLDIHEGSTDWAILRVERELSFSPRALGFRQPGARAFVEMPTKMIEGSIDAVEITMDIQSTGMIKRRYRDVFEVSLDSPVEEGGSGAVVSDQQGNVLGIVIGTVVRDGGVRSALAVDANGVLERHDLQPVTIDEVSSQPRIGILLEGDEAASAFFERLLRVSRFSRSGRLYFRGVTRDGVRVTCTILREANSVAAAIAMTSMLIDNRPDGVFIVSRCGGLRPNQSIGDVVISSEVLIFEPTFMSNELNHIRPQVLVTPLLLQRLGHDMAIDGRFGRLHVGSLASVSSALGYVDASVISSVARNVAALDVGAAGAIQAANAISKELPIAVVSVITDLVSDNQKTDAPLFSYRAVDVVLEMLSRLKLRVHAKRRTLIIKGPNEFG